MRGVTGPAFDGDPAEVHGVLARHVGSAAAVVFAVALVVAGLASASVGTYAGQVVMQGFVGRRIPLVVRRLVTIAPSLVVLALVDDVTGALFASQVVLCFGIPFALVPLLLVGRRADLMGAHRNGTLTTAVAGTVAVCVIAVDVFVFVEAWT
jgi:manganese transport protein